MTKPSIYLKHEMKIVANERGSIEERLRYGLDLIKEKAGHKKLPVGKIELLIKEAAEAGIKISEREIQRRIKCAEVYVSVERFRRQYDGISAWTTLHEAGFPVVESTPEDLPYGISAAAPDEWEQLSLVPGLGEVLKVRGRSIPLTEATIADVIAYRDMYAGIHSNFAKRLALIENALRIMREAEGNEDGNALDAWRRGVSS